MLLIICTLYMEGYVIANKMILNLHIVFVSFLGTYCQQREVEAITEGVDEDDGK